MPDQRDDFYVGYLPIPHAHARLIRVGVPALLWLCALVVGALAWTQRDPGPASWSALGDGAIGTWTGIYRAEPYPMLESTNNNGQPVTYLIVRQGKLGAPDTLDIHDGKRVWVEGWAIRRQGRTMIELAPDEGFRPDIEQTTYSPPTPPEQLGTVTLRGEIVDSKCYLGAMKPGDGKAHRACATLCINGGIPPTLITYADDSENGFYLLTTHDGRSAVELVRPFIAQPVSITGELEQHGDIALLRVADDGIKRITR